MLRLNPYTVNTLSVAGLARGLFATPITVTAYVMWAGLLLLLFRAIMRNTWLAAAALAPLVAVSAMALLSGISLLSAILYSLPFLWVMIRFGILPCVLMTAVAGTTFNWPLTSDFSSWYAHIGLIMLALVMTLAVWSFRNALGGRKVLQDDLL